MFVQRRNGNVTHSRTKDEERADLYNAHNSIQIDLSIVSRKCLNKLTTQGVSFLGTCAACSAVEDMARREAAEAPYACARRLAAVKALRARRVADMAGEWGGRGVSVSEVESDSAWGFLRGSDRQHHLQRSGSPVDYAMFRTRGRVTGPA